MNGLHRFCAKVVAVAGNKKGAKAPL